MIIANLHLALSMPQPSSKHYIHYCFSSSQMQLSSQLDKMSCWKARGAHVCVHCVFVCDNI